MPDSRVATYYQSALIVSTLFGAYNIYTSELRISHNTTRRVPQAIAAMNLLPCIPRAVSAWRPSAYTHRH